jgi:thiamine pyrophosphokinase
LRALVFCGGVIEDYEAIKPFLKGELILCADGGAKHLRKLAIKPDWLLGDFDSIDGEDLEEFREKDVNILQYHRKKDYTDGEIGVEKALELGAKEIFIFGATGGRMDHTLGNVYLLEKILDQGAHGTIITGKDEIRCTRAQLSIKGSLGDYLSLLPLDPEVEGIFTTGLEYPLKGESLFRGSTRGLSNTFVEREAKITVKNGTLLVIKSMG